MRPPGDVVVEAGGPAPTGPSGEPVVLFRVGDVLQVSCPFASAQVKGADDSRVVLRWPWPPASEVVFAFEDLDITPFRTEPEPRSLHAGEQCLVGIPTTELYVGRVQAVRTPHPTVTLGVAPANTPPVVDLQPKGYLLDPYGAEPIRVERLFRPYLFLDDGDIVTDPGGTRWRFVPPYWFVPDLPDPAPGGPPWPLTLVDRAGKPALPAQIAEVRTATAAGSHNAVLATWQRCTGVEPEWLRPDTIS